MERKIVYFPEPSATLLAERPARREPCVRDQELAALTAAIRKAEAIANNFTN